MVVFLFLDVSDLESENMSEIVESDNESDIFVFSVNIEDFLDLEFLDDEENGEIRWSRDRVFVNVIFFITRVGVVSGVVEDGIVKDFFQLFIFDELFDMIVKEINRYVRQCITRKLDLKWKDISFEDM